MFWNILFLFSWVYDQNSKYNFWTTKANWVQWPSQWFYKGTIDLRHLSGSWHYRFRQIGIWIKMVWTRFAYGLNIKPNNSGNECLLCTSKTSKVKTCQKNSPKASLVLFSFPCAFMWFFLVLNVNFVILTVQVCIGSCCHGCTCINDDTLLDLPMMFQMAWRFLNNCLFMYPQARKTPSVQIK